MFMHTDTALVEGVCVALAAAAEHAPTVLQARAVGVLDKVGVRVRRGVCGAVDALQEMEEVVVDKGMDGSSVEENNQVCWCVGLLFVCGVVHMQHTMLDPCVCFVCMLHILCGCFIHHHPLSPMVFVSTPHAQNPVKTTHNTGFVHCPCISPTPASTINTQQCIGR